MGANSRKLVGLHARASEYRSRSSSFELTGDSGSDSFRYEFLLSLLENQHNECASLMEKSAADSVLIHLRDVIAAETGVDAIEIKPDTTLVSLVTDSLEMLNLVMEIEGSFNVVLDDSALEKIVTVADAVKFIEDNQ